MKENCQRATDDRTMTVPSDGSRCLVDGALHKFRQEALKLASISHPNIVRVIDVFEEEPLNTESNIWDMPNVIITPHNSFVGDLNQERLWTLIQKNLIRQRREMRDE